MEVKAPHAQCGQCPLKDRPLVRGKFRGVPKYIIVGEAPGRTEARKGEPFVGASGQLLDALLKYVGVDPDACFVTNTVLCHPQGNEFNQEARACCHPRLMHELRAVRAKYPVPVCVLGKEARNAILSEDSVFTERNYWQLSDEGWPVLPVYHPAFALRMPYQVRDLMLGFAKLGKPIPKQLPVEPDTEFVVLEDGNSVIKWVYAMLNGKRHIAWDLETDQIDWRKDRILCLGASWEPGKAIVIPGELMYHSVGTRLALQDLFASKNITFVAHNGMFDVKFMKHHYDVDARVDFDTLLAHYVLDERTGRGEIHSLKTLAKIEFDVPDYEGELVQKYLSKRSDRYSKVPKPQLYEYCAIDCDYTLRLVNVFEPQLLDEGLYDRPFMDPIMAMVAPTVEMEMEGFPIDKARLEQVEHDLIEERDLLVATMIRLFNLPEDFNANSHAQKKKLLYEQLGAKLVRGRDFKEGSTAASARAKLKEIYGPNTKRNQFLTLEQIEALDNPIAQLLALLDHYSRVEKMRSSYVSNIIPLIDNGRVYPWFRLHGTETGRLAASDPAIQTIPRASEKYGRMIKTCFRAPKGWSILQVDYSQAELRVAAALSGDEFLIKVFADGRDLHSEVARAMYGDAFTKDERILTKMFNFSYLYGGSEKSFAADAGLPMAVAKQWVAQYNATMPQLAEWKDECAEFMYANGYVQTPFNRKRRFPLIINMNRNEARKASVNMPTQSSASDLTLTSTVLVYDWLNDNPKLKQYVKLLITVHDSIILLVKTPLVKDVGRHLKAVMEEVGNRFFPNVPWRADVEAGPSWGELKEVDLEP